ncbi:MAG: RNAse [Alphaproteobacteria bacterium]|nr:RNAse [Alphaproteobacteria bacterium]
MAGICPVQAVPEKNRLMSPLEEKLGHEFADKELLKRALTHSSAGPASYERLEFLGDRILSFVIADMLFTAFKNEEEGALAKRHSTLVKQGALEKVACALCVSDHMHYANQKPTKSMMADVVEALIAALYLDGGFAVAEKFIRSHWEELIRVADLPPEDAKSALQEWAQARGLPLPVYKVLERSGPDHDPIFVIEAKVSDYPSQQAQSKSKQAAQKLAARSLIDYLRTTHG